MVSEKRAAANRRNAAKSTGPRSAAGLAKAATNALAHGLCAARPVLPGESADDWDRHRAGVVAALAPAGGLESALAERVAACLWRLRRVVAYETAVTAAGLEEAADPLPPDGDDLAAPADVRRLRRVEKKLAEARETHALWADTADLSRRLPDLPDDAPVDPAALDGLFSDVNGALPGGDETYFEFDDRDFLAGLGIPPAHRDRPYDWPGWTAGLVRRAVAVAAASAETTGDAALAAARAERLGWAGESAGAITRLEGEAADLRRRIADRHRRAILRAAVPDAATLEKVTRYEAHLSRQMLQALHTLERFQAARVGVPVSPPAALDVTLDAPPPLPPAG